jgi:hypothetical protein
MPYETGSVKDREVQVEALAYPAGKYTLAETVILERDRLSAVETEPSIWNPAHATDTDALLRISPNYEGDELPGLDQ